ncbi:MAG: hypothetical protein WAQ98_24345 [Blastocatellia bacterium]
MRVISFEETDTFYAIGKQCKVVRHWVKNEDLANYCFLFKRLKRELEEFVNDDFWKALLQSFSRYLYDQCAAPLPANEVAIVPEKLLSMTTRYTRQVKFMYSDYTESIEALFNELKSLISLDKNPLLEKIIEIIKPTEKTALVIKNSRLIPEVERILRSQQLFNIEIISIDQLKRNTFYKKLILLGAGCWFPDFVFTSPRAEEINIVCYSWIRDKKRDTSVFASPLKTENKANFEIEELSDYKDMGQIKSLPTNKGVIIEADEVLPTIDWSNISKQFSSLSSTDKQERVKAKLFLLEGSLGVFLECDEKSSSLVIDLEEDISPVNRKAIIEINPGMFILLRTSGGGDLIVPIADRILEDRAEVIRKVQKFWKDRFRIVFERLGVRETVRQLKNFGSIRANEINIRNWMSYKNIKTDDYKDFLAIMKLINQEPKVKEFWQVMELIDKAHRKAGRHIRKLLLRKIKEADLSELERLGKKTFELSETEGGSLTAFRVVEVSQDTFEIPISRLADVFELTSYFQPSNVETSIQKNLFDEM